MIIGIEDIKRLRASDLHFHRPQWAFANEDDQKACLPRHDRVRAIGKLWASKALMNYLQLNDAEYPGVEQRGKAGDMTCFAREKVLGSLLYPFYQEV